MKILGILELARLEDLLRQEAQLFKGLSNVMHGGVLTGVGLGITRAIPPIPQLFNRGDINITVVQIPFNFGHVFHQESSILTNRIAAQGRRAIGTMLGY